MDGTERERPRDDPSAAGGIAAHHADEVEHARLILETANDGFISTDRSSVIVEWNRSAERILGWTRAEVLGRTLTETLIPERFRAAHDAGIARFLETGEGPVLFQTLELPALRRDGGEFTAELTIWPSQLDGAYRFNAFIRDVSQRQRLQSHLQLLQRVTAAANAASDLRAALLTALEEVSTLTGWPVGHAYVRGWDEERLAPTGWWTKGAEAFEDFRAVTERISFAPGNGLPGRVAAAGEPEWLDDVVADPNFPRHAVARDAGLMTGLAFPVFSEQRVVAVLEFYSDQRQSPDPDLLDLMRNIGVQLGRVFERLRWRSELNQAVDAQAKLLAMIAHEFRTPLVAVEGFAKLLVEDWDDTDDADRRLRLGVIHRHATRLQKMVSKAVVAASIEAGTIEVTTEAVPLTGMLRQTVQDLGMSEVGVDGDTSVVAAVDRDHLLQILTNYLANAVAYGAAPIAIEVERVAATDSDPGAAIVRVRDHGPGVAPAFVSDLFRSFRRGSVGGSGAGLGLSIVRELAERNGGEAWYEPLRPVGAVFAVKIPLAD